MCVSDNTRIPLEKPPTHWPTKQALIHKMLYQNASRKAPADPWLIKQATIHKMSYQKGLACSDRLAAVGVGIGVAI